MSAPHLRQRMRCLMQHDHEGHQNHQDHQDFDNDNDNDNDNDTALESIT